MCRTTMGKCLNADDGHARTRKGIASPVHTESVNRSYQSGNTLALWPLSTSVLPFLIPTTPRRSLWRKRGPSKPTRPRPAAGAPSAASRQLPWASREPGALPSACCHNLSGGFRDEGSLAALWVSGSPHISPPPVAGFLTWVPWGGVGKGDGVDEVSSTKDQRLLMRMSETCSLLCCQAYVAPEALSTVRETVTLGPLARPCFGPGMRGAGRLWESRRSLLQWRRPTWEPAA